MEILACVEYLSVNYCNFYRRITKGKTDQYGVDKSGCTIDILLMPVTLVDG